MKSKIFTTSLLATALFLGMGVAPAMAQRTNTPAIDRAQETISARIQQGMASGHITPSEARELYRRDRDIDMRESRFKANGSATPQERQQLRSDLDALGAEVERMIANRDYIQRGGNTNTNGIDNRQLDLGERIDQAVRSGDLSERQARRLQRREREIARHEVSFKRDGVVTRQERRQLRNEIRQLNKDLDRMMRKQRNWRN